MTNSTLILALVVLSGCGGGEFTEADSTGGSAGAKQTVVVTTGGDSSAGASGTVVGSTGGAAATGGQSSTGGGATAGTITITCREAQIKSLCAKLSGCLWTACDLTPDGCCFTCDPGGQCHW
jgi:hypothetical protein